MTTFTDSYGDTLHTNPRDDGGAHLEPGRGNTNDVLHFDLPELIALRDHLTHIINEQTKADHWTVERDAVGDWEAVAPVTNPTATHGGYAYYTRTDGRNAIGFFTRSFAEEVAAEANKGH